jgi:hypothetical protein
VGHKYENQFQTEADLEKIRMPRVSHEAGLLLIRKAEGREEFRLVKIQFVSDRRPTRPVRVGGFIGALVEVRTPRLSAHVAY